MDASKAIDVGAEKQLFLDNRWFAASHGMTLRVNPPVKAERVLKPERPWESRGLGTFNTVLEHQEEYLLWYSAGIKGEQGYRHCMCFATSADGVHFGRKNVGRYALGGSAENNIVIPGGVGMAMLDPAAPEEQRFKMLISMAEDDAWPDAKGVNLRSWEIHVGVSPDGIRWKLLKPAALPFCHDTQNQMLYDTRLRKYVAYVRTHEYGRTVSRVEVEDPLTLPFPHLDIPVTNFGSRGTRMPPRGVLDVVIFRDGSDPPNTDIYTPYVHQYPWAADAYFSFPSVYRHYPAEREADTLAEGRDSRGVFRNDGCLDVQLGVSRDGINWTRPERQPYVPLGLEGSWDGGSVYMALGMIRKGDEVWQYYYGIHHTHGRKDLAEAGWGGGLGRLVQRLDGFVSADADYTGGEFTTPLLTFSGPYLRLNLDCSALGEAWVEILDENNLPIPGYTLGDSISIDRNQIAAPVIWREHEDVGDLIGRPVKLHLKLRACKLYAFQFQTER